MKKILFAALAALAITSCSQNEIDGIDNGTPKSKNEIGVNTIVKKSSRATVTSNSSFTSFKLHAYIIKSSDIATSGWGNAYMDGIEYKGGQGNWATTSGTFYWPITEMQFFGYTNDVTYTAPASSSAYPTISYTLPDTPADQKDIIVAYSKDITKPSDNTLNLTFQHILTRINFAAKLADSNYTYTVESITITGAKGSKTRVALPRLLTSLSAPASGYSYTFDNTVTAKDDIYDYTQNNNSLMLYPQSLTDAKITVKYKTEKDNATFFNGSKEVALTGEWTNGQSIRYILTLPVGAEKMSVNTTYDEDWNATDNEQTPKTPVL